MLFELYREQGVSTWIEATGWSMNPGIRPGSELLVEFGAAYPGVGEIVVFVLGDTIVSHRVVGWRRHTGGRRLLTKGDAVMHFDPSLDEADVLGVVRALRHDPDSTPESSSCRGRRAVALAAISVAAWLLARVARAIPVSALARAIERLTERVAGSLMTRVVHSGAPRVNGERRDELDGAG